MPICQPLIKSKCLRQLDTKLKWSVWEFLVSFLNLARIRTIFISKMALLSELIDDGQEHCLLWGESTCHHPIFLTMAGQFLPTAVWLTATDRMEKSMLNSKPDTPKPNSGRQFLFIFPMEEWWGHLSCSLCTRSLLKLYRTDRSTFGDEHQEY